MHRFANLDYRLFVFSDNVLQLAEGAYTTKLTLEKETRPFGYLLSLGSGVTFTDSWIRGLVK
jgi:hypothetical protein